MGSMEIDCGGVRRAADDYLHAASALASAADGVRGHGLIPADFGRHYGDGARDCLRGLDRLAGGLELWCAGAQAVGSGLGVSVAALAGADAAAGQRVRACEVASGAEGTGDAG